MSDPNLQTKLNAEAEKGVAQRRSSQSWKMTAKQGRSGQKLRRRAHSQQGRPHGRVVQGPGVSSDLDQKGGSTGTPGPEREREDEALGSDRPSNGAVVPCGAQMGDPAIWTPLPTDPEEAPVIIARSKRNIPGQVVVYEKRKYTKPRRVEQENTGPSK